MAEYPRPAKEIKTYIRYLLLRKTTIAIAAIARIEITAMIFVDFILPAITRVITLPIIINSQNKFKVMLAGWAAMFLASLKNVGAHVATIVSEEQ